MGGGQPYEPPAFKGAQWGGWLDRTGVPHGGGDCGCSIGCLRCASVYYPHLAVIGASERAVVYVILALECAYVAIASDVVVLLMVLAAVAGEGGVFAAGGGSFWWWLSPLRFSPGDLCWHTTISQKKKKTPISHRISLASRVV